MDIAPLASRPLASRALWEDLARFQRQIEAAGGRICSPYSVQDCPRHGPMQLMPAPRPRRSALLRRPARWECPVCGLRR